MNGCAFSVFTTSVIRIIAQKESIFLFMAFKIKLLNKLILNYQYKKGGFNIQVIKGLISNSPLIKGGLRGLFILCVLVCLINQN